MDVTKTGNLFLTLPNSEMTEKELAYAANNWAIGKAASRTAFFSAYTGFELQVLEGEEIFDDPETEANESNNPLNLPTLVEIDFMEKQYHQVMIDVFGYDAVKDEVDKDGKLLYANYAAYLDALEVDLRARTMDDGSGVNVIGTQLASITGMKNIYRQYMDWKKIHYVAPA